MRNIKRIILVALWLFAPFSWGQEEMVIVMGKATSVSKLTKSEVIDIFMGRYTAYPDGNLAVAVELTGEPALRELFYEKLINKSLASVNSYWARLKFSGRKRSAVEKESVVEVIAYLERHPQAIGYLPINAVTDNLKVVYRLNE